MYIPTNESYFSGGGLLDYGMFLAGVNTVRSLEYDPVCCETLRLNYDHEIDQRDISKIMVLDKQRADIMSLTFPCTKYSTIADIHGTRTGDELFLHAFRHIALKLPEAFIVENVPGMQKFPIVMEAMSKIPGYYMNVFCPLDAATWLPQRRKRLILIGTRKRFHISPPTEGKKILLKDIIDEIPDMHIPDYVMKRINGGYRDKPIITDPNDIHAIAPTCVAHYSKDQGTRLVVDRSHPNGVRPYSLREYARLQGLPDSYKLAGSVNDGYKQIGNGVAVHVGEWIGKELIKYFN